MMENSPTISIIIPAYNAENYIKDCVASILSQTYSDYEVIIVDDGSKDATAQICDELALNDSRVRVYHQPNGGAGASRKFGVSKAHGDWVMFVDSDDTVTRTGISLLLTQANDETDLICGALNKNGRIFKHQIEGFLEKREYIEALLTVKTTDGPVAKLIRRNLFEQIAWNTPREITQNEDMLMLIELATSMNNKAFLSSDIVCYNYISRTGSSSNAKMKYESWLLLFKSIEGLLSPELINNEMVSKAFCEYRLKRLYRNLIQRGTVIRKDEYVSGIIAEAARLGINDPCIKVITSIIRQRKEYLVVSFWNTISKIKQRILSVAKY
ncbi:glycosyltransferase family 2 protein [Xylanibacter brevis]|uniref:glycosyltransferase family 2 protein n=1 Tax=Xylanibacter brevis TaxID=83231 RepID=UPI000694CC13|nr:glycosyltransferase family 2 protein [Xylanibacter brevis]